MRQRSQGEAHPAMVDARKGLGATLRSLWVRASLRNVHFADRHKQLDELYRLEDPWGLSNEAERTRFQRTNEIIQREFGHLGTIFEIGSGEGVQSGWFVQICDRLYGRDISKRAVQRARARYPAAAFDVGDLNAAFVSPNAPPFDLVVACEVLYYIKDTKTAIETMSRIGRRCLVTYFHAQQSDVEARTPFPARAKRDTIINDELTWHVVYWTNDIEDGPLS